MADSGLLSLLRKRLFPQKEANGQQQDGEQTVVGAPGFSLGDIILGAASGYAKGSQAGVPEAGLASGLGTGYETAKSLSDRRRVDDALRGFEGSPEFKTLTPVEQAEFRASPSTFFQKKREPKVKVMLSTLIPNVDKSIDREVELDPEALARFAKPAGTGTFLDPTVAALYLQGFGIKTDPSAPPKLKPGDATALAGLGNLREKQEKEAEAKRQAQEKEQKAQEDVRNTVNRVVSKIDELIPRINRNTAGFVGSKLRGVGGTSAQAVAADLETIKSNLGLEQLMAMKAASPTGASGFGALSAPELSLLVSKVASIDQAQTPEQLKARLQEIRGYFTQKTSNRSPQSKSQVSTIEKPAPLTFATEEEAAAAGLAPGTPVVVGGVEGVWQ